MYTLVKNFILTEDGATAVEYAVLLALILVTIIGGLTAAGASTAEWWTNINGEMATHGM